MGFTGSTATGKHVHEVVSADLKRLTLELGGKSPIVICADADLDAAARGAAAGFLAGSGQACTACTAGTRLFVQESIRAGGETPGERFTHWLREFFTFSSRKRHIAAELLSHVESDSPVFDRNRAKVVAASRPLLAAAQDSREIRHDLTLRQILDLIVAIAVICGDAAYIEPIFKAALDGLRPEPSAFTK